MFKNINKNSLKSANFRHFLILIIVFTTLSGCIKNTDLVGYTFKSENIDLIKAGKTNKFAVRQILGSPSVTSTYGDIIWYYISTEYESVAFFKPKVRNQKIVAITFDKNDMVNNLKEYSAKDVTNIQLSNDSTKAEGSDVGIIGQLLGNIGRFNSSPGKPKITKPKNAPHYVSYDDSHTR